MKVINQAIGRGNASDGSPRAHWKAVRRPMVFAAVALALLLIAAAGAGNNSAGDIAAAGVIGAVVGYFLLRMLAQGPRRTHFEYADGRPAYPNTIQRYASTDEANEGCLNSRWEKDDLMERDIAQEMALAMGGMEPYVTIYGSGHDE